MDLSLRFEDNGTAHRDLVMEFAGQTWIADSYYLALDGGVQPEREDGAKVRDVLRRLLKQWESAVEELAIEENIYLPFDFSDQCTGWLRCRRTENTIEICWGWANVEGYSFFPSDIGEHLGHLPSFHAEEPCVCATHAELLQAVRTSLHEIS